jgi:hypothetical protein
MIGWKTVHPIETENRQIWLLSICERTVGSTTNNNCWRPKITIVEKNVFKNILLQKPYTTISIKLLDFSFWFGLKLLNY